MGFDKEITKNGLFMYGLLKVQGGGGKGGLWHNRIIVKTTLHSQNHITRMMGNNRLPEKKINIMHLMRLRSIYIPANVRIAL